MSFPPPFLRRLWLNFTLKEKLGFCFGGSIFLLSLLYSYIVSQSVQNRLEAEKLIFLRQVATELVYTFSRGMFERYNDIGNLTVLDVFRQAGKDKDKRRQYLEKLQQTYQYYAWIGFATTDGIVEVATQRLLEGVDVSKRPWFQEGLKRPFVGDVHEAVLLAKKLPPLPNNEPWRFLDIAFPVYNHNGQLIGVLAAHLSWEWVKEVNNSLLLHLPPAQGFEIIILNREGVVILHTAKTSPQEVLPQASLSSLLNDSRFFTFSRQDTGYYDYPGLGWHILVRQPKQTALQPAFQLQREIILWGLLLASLFSFLGWWIAHSITQPLLSIAQQAHRLLQGERQIPLITFPLPPHSTPRNEILLLSLSLRDLVNNLIQQEKLLQNLNQQLEEKVRERTKKLEEAKEIAEKASKAKSVFLASMSHEFRTPLNAILGFTQILLDNNNLDDDARENLKIILNSGEHLLSLINEVLEISKIESGKIELRENSFSLSDLIYSLKSMLQIKATEKNLQLIFNVADNLPRYIIADEGKLRQVLLNLISNSLKFTQSGSITVTAKLEGENRLYFAVSDTGRGMKPEELQRLFTPFFQTQSGIESKQGTGLGLVISRQFVRMMGGDIRVTSEFNRGTTFEFTIQFTPAQSSPEKTFHVRGKIIGLPPNTPPHRILIVDDEDNNRLLLKKLLQPLGFPLQEATNGKEALEKWKNWQPTLVFMDIGMPELDGCQATRLIRQQDTRHTTTIIAVTAHAFMEEREKILAAGCDDIISKPFVKEILFEKIKQLLQLEYLYESTPPLSPSSQPPTPTHQTPISASPTILVAEDNKVNQKLILTLLTKLGIAAEIANNGKEAIHKATTKPYSLILMDIEMPEIDGITAIKEIRRLLPPNSLPPIIAMTAHDDTTTRQICQETAIQDYLCKPIRQATLKSLLEKWLHHYRFP